MRRRDAPQLHRRPEFRHSIRDAEEEGRDCQEILVGQGQRLLHRRGERQRGRRVRRRDWRHGGHPLRQQGQGQVLRGRRKETGRERHDRRDADVQNHMRRVRPRRQGRREAIRRVRRREHRRAEGENPRQLARYQVRRQQAESRGEPLLLVDERRREQGNRRMDREGQEGRDSYRI